MSNDFDDLIIQLKSLRLRHKQILKQLEQTVAEEGQVIRRIEVQQEALMPTRPPQHQHVTPTRTLIVSRFVVGERVYISNEVKQKKGNLRCCRRTGERRSLASTQTTLTRSSLSWTTIFIPGGLNTTSSTYPHLEACPPGKPTT